jgi:hypothetical protein
MASMNNPNWYSTDENVTVQNRRSVDLEEALAIVQRYYAEVRPFYETFEEAMSATMFGFSRSDEEFIEICMCDPGEISVKIELPVTGTSWIPRFLRAPFQHEETVQSLGAVEERVRQFFTMAPNELKAAVSEFQLP